MRRGSRPGERRGGRNRGTPNRRTILRDRILSLGSDHPAASQRAFFRKLVTDRQLPADTRIAITGRCFPPKRARSCRVGQSGGLAGGRSTIAQQPLATDSSVAASSLQPPESVPTIRDWNPKALDAWLGVVQDATADPKARRKAALKITEFLLPKIGKKAEVIPDEYGFLISPKLATAYRDIQLRLRDLKGEPTRKIPAIAAEIKKLEARSAAIIRRPELPCPSRYGDKEAHNDAVRLGEFGALRYHKKALTEAENAEEAHVRARLDVFRAGPEAIARRRCAALEEAERRFRKYRLDGGLYAPPLSRKERKEHKFWRGLYPAEPKRDLSQLDSEFEWYRDHPFVDALLAPDGNFYPRDSKLRPAATLEKGMFYLEGPKARIYELEKRRVSESFTPTEEEELQDLRQRHPRIAAVVSNMNLLYDYWFEYELKIATKAGLDIGAAIRQAKDFCLRFEKVGCMSQWDLQQLRDDGTWSYHPLASPPADTVTQPSNEPKPTK